MNYNYLRNLYYTGILLLIVYALPKIGFITKYVKPIFEYELIAGLPVISIIAMVMLVAGFVAWKYRRIG